MLLVEQFAAAALGWPTARGSRTAAPLHGPPEACAMIRA
jgi:hypothetical protein